MPRAKNRRPVGQLATNRKVWQLQDFETEIEFDYFNRWLTEKHYVGSAAIPTRSIVATAETVGIQKGKLYELSSVNLWAERARAWDDYMQEQELREERNYRIKMKRRHLEVSDKIIDLAVLEAERLTQLVKEGEPMKPLDIAKMLDVASKLQRVTVGEATEITKTTEEYDLTKLTTEELDQLRALQSKVKV